MSTFKSNKSQTKIVIPPIAAVNLKFIENNKWHSCTLCWFWARNCNDVPCSSVRGRDRVDGKMGYFQEV